VAEAPREPAVAVLGAVLGFLGVLAGAFGAHALEGRLTPEMHAIWETGARYQLVHAVVLLFTGWIGARAAGWLVLAGIVIFSGSLYALALTGVRGLGAVTPLGGLCLLAGWLALAWRLARHTGQASL
jgi:uncharacterized membrane protein YgdD (TMEM256/DUF423 family)